MKKLFKNQKGFTLVELLAVIVILGIIAAIAVPSIGNIIQKSREDAVLADAQQFISAAELYAVSNDVTAGKLSYEELDPFLKISDESKWDKDEAYVDVTEVDGEFDFTFTGTGKAGSKEIKFTGASAKDINKGIESDNIKGPKE